MDLSYYKKRVKQNRKSIMDLYRQELSYRKD